MYPWMKLLTTGKIFLAGAVSKTALFNPNTNRWAGAGVTKFGNRFYGAAVLLPGTADKPLSKVLIAGGTHFVPGGSPTATAEVIDLSVPTPTWNYVAPMHTARYTANLVILADGTLLTVGGAQTKKYGTPVQIPEIYDPVANTWTEMATQTATRPYHSTAILLPDGTVMSAGSDDPMHPDTGRTYEIFSPPYLFNGPRPVVSTAPTSLGYASNFVITTPDAASIKTVALVRPGATTHDAEMDQRYLPLKFKALTGQLKVMSPPNANYAPPGWYMLVIVNTNGVPSVMPFLRLQ